MNFSKIVNRHLSNSSSASNTSISASLTTEASSLNSGFDSIAPLYTWLEELVYKKSMQDSRIAFSMELKTKPNILILGEGPGRFVSHISQILKNSNIHIVEESQSMRSLIIETIKNCSHSKTGNKFYIYDSLDKISSRDKGCFDGIVTHFYLDMFMDADLLKEVKSISKYASKDAVWLYSDFSTSANKPFFWRLRNQFLLWFMYQFFGIVSNLECKTLEDPKIYHQNQGWDIAAEMKFNQEFILARLLKRSR